MQTVIRHPLPDNPSDAGLAAGIVAHDQDAFVILMRRHNQRLFRTARSILHNDAEAEDAVQESYLQAYRSINTFRGDAKLSTWLTRIVVNQSLARIRRTGRRAHITSPPGSLLAESGAHGAGDHAGVSDPAERSAREQ